MRHQQPRLWARAGLVTFKQPMNYYNENDPKAAAWLRTLIGGGLIANGYVDERSITDVKPTELHSFAQCHFFAGIGGWPLSLILAGWPSDRRVWTGSCPCQPFSAAGKQLGEQDARHLWPVFRDLIAECQPPTVFGEQVASKAGRNWLVGVRANLEGMGYAVGAADLCAAGVGAPHIRQRLYWVANARFQQAGRCARPDQTQSGGAPSEFAGRGIVGGLAFPQGVRLQGRSDRGERFDSQPDRLFSDGPSKHVGAWESYDVLQCTDGKARRVESGTFPLAHGVPGRVGLLRGYGNAIVPQLAATFIEAFNESIA